MQPPRACRCSPALPKIGVGSQMNPRKGKASKRIVTRNAAAPRLSVLACASGTPSFAQANLRKVQFFDSGALHSRARYIGQTSTAAAFLLVKGRGILRAAESKPSASSCSSERP